MARCLNLLFRINQTTKNAENSIQKLASSFLSDLHNVGWCRHREDLFANYRRLPFLSLFTSRNPSSTHFPPLFGFFFSPFPFRSPQLRRHSTAISNFLEKKLLDSFCHEKFRFIIFYCLSLSFFLL